MSMKRGIALAMVVGMACSVNAQEAMVSPDGDAPIRVYTARPGEVLTIGDPIAGIPADLSGQFIPAGQDPEADGHQDVKYLASGDVIVANRASRNLTVFDPTTRAHVRTYALSGSPVSMALTPDGSRAITANHFEDTVSIVDLASGAETVVPVGDKPLTVRITPNGARAVVNCGGAGNLTVIDIATGTIEREITVAAPRYSFSVNFESQGVGLGGGGFELVDDSTAIFPEFFNSQVKLIDLNTGLDTPIATSPNPSNIVVVGARAYVTHTFPNTVVTEIDLTTATAPRTFTTPSACNGPITARPDGSKLAVAVQNATVIIDTVSGLASGPLDTASVNQLHTTPDGQYAVAVGFRGAIIDYNTQTVVAQPNQFVSASIGAVSPTGDQAVLFSDTFGEDMVVLSLNGGASSRLSAGPSGPAPEGDKTRVVALTPDGGRAIAVNQHSQTATIVDTASGNHLAIVPIGRRAGDAVVTPDGTKALVASRDGTALSVIDLSTYAVTEVTISTRADQIAVSPDSQYAYVPVITGGDGVWRINLNTLSVEGPKLPTGDMGSVGSTFAGLALSHDGATLMTCDSFGSTVTFIDAVNWAVQGTVSVGAGQQPVRAVFSPDDTRVYVSAAFGDRILVLNNAGGASGIIAQIPVGDYPIDLRMTGDGSRIYVLNTGSSDSIGIVDTAALAQVGTISFSTLPTISGFALSPDEGTIYAAHGTGTYTFGNGGLVIAQSNILSVVDVATATETEFLELPDWAAGLALSADGSMLAMPNLMSEGLTLVSLSGQACYANCDNSTTAPVLNVADFTCFLQRFAAGESYANCDQSTTAPVLNVADFTCFLQSFAAGCQ